MSFLNSFNKSLQSIFDYYVKRAKLRKASFTISNINSSGYYYSNYY